MQRAWSIASDFLSNVVDSAHAILVGLRSSRVVVPEAFFLRRLTSSLGAVFAPSKSGSGSTSSHGTSPPASLTSAQDPCNNSGNMNMMDDYGEGSKPNYSSDLSDSSSQDNNNECYYPKVIVVGHNHGSQVCDRQLVRFFQSFSSDHQNHVLFFCCPRDPSSTSASAAARHPGAHRGRL